MSIRVLRDWCRPWVWSTRRWGLVVIVSFGLTSISVNVDSAIRREHAHITALDVLLAAHEFQRRDGEFPATQEQLIPTFLAAMPVDLMDSTGAVLNYRRDKIGETVAWSLGRDERDDDGHVEVMDWFSQDEGYRLRIRPTASS